MKLISFLLVSALVLGCKTPKAGNGADSVSMEEASVAANGAAVPIASTLGAGDLVEVRVFQETDLSGPFRVSVEGTIDYPLCGKVNVSKMTSSQAADAITTCLKNGFFKAPNVTVLIREYNSKKVFVFGEVQKPGTFPFEESMNIIQAVTLAGGFTRQAAKNSINVTRQLGGTEKKIRVPVEDIGIGREKNFLLQPGDIVFVPESIF
ncbi:MAG: polysaccharide export protein [Myxococcaceae bacterium]|nr:polysaccharide export protein [Myxococcaceae bacterium]